MRRMIRASPATPPTTPPTTAGVEVLLLLELALLIAVDEGDVPLAVVAPPPDPAPPTGPPVELVRLTDEVVDERCEDVGVVGEEEIEVRWVDDEADFERLLEDDGEIVDDVDAVDDPVIEEDCVVVDTGAWVDLDCVASESVVVEASEKTS